MLDWTPYNVRFAIFMGLALKIYCWKDDFAAEQFAMWIQGIRDSRIHDATYYLYNQACLATDVIG